MYVLSSVHRLITIIRSQNSTNVIGVYDNINLVYSDVVRAIGNLKANKQKLNSFCC